MGSYIGRETMLMGRYMGYVSVIIPMGSYGIRETILMIFKRVISIISGITIN
jgi:hypothetical protein